MSDRPNMSIRLASRKLVNRNLPEGFAPLMTRYSTHEFMGPAEGYVDANLVGLACKCARQTAIVDISINSDDLARTRRPAQEAECGIPSLRRNVNAEGIHATT